MENQTRDTNSNLNPSSQKGQAAAKGAGAPLTRKLGDFDKNHEMESALTDTKEKGSSKSLRDSDSEDSERNITQMAKDWIAPITEQVGQFESRVEGFIKARPLTILAGVVVAGYLANRFLFSASAKAKEVAGARK